MFWGTMMKKVRAHLNREWPDEYDKQRNEEIENQRKRGFQKKKDVG